MVASTQTQSNKANGKTPVSKLEHAKFTRELNGTVSPTGSASSSLSTEDELLVLRARNKVLTEAIQSIKESADKELQRTYDLVWFAKYRYRYPNHSASKRIDEKYSEEIEKLRSDDGDYHHGFNSGMLAAARLFKQQADLDLGKLSEPSAELMAEAAKHSKRIVKAQESFPDTEVSNDGFPSQD